MSDDLGTAGPQWRIPPSGTSPQPIVVNPREAELLKQHPDFVPPYSSRIPAAIAKAEGLVHVPDDVWLDGNNIIITATEVALASQLWDCWEDEYSGTGFGPPEALIEFVTKVESLD